MFSLLRCATTRPSPSAARRTFRQLDLSRALYLELDISFQGVKVKGKMKVDLHGVTFDPFVRTFGVMANLPYTQTIPLLFHTLHFLWSLCSCSQCQ